MSEEIPYEEYIKTFKKKKYCFYCNVQVIKTNANIDNRQTLDHIIPKCKGGKSDRYNIVICCHSCNAKKGTMSAQDFKNTITSKLGGL